MRQRGIDGWGEGRVCIDSREQCRARIREVLPPSASVLGFLLGLKGLPFGSLQEDIQDIEQPAYRMGNKKAPLWCVYVCVCVYLRVCPVPKEQESKEARRHILHGTTVEVQ